MNTTATLLIVALLTVGAAVLPAAAVSHPAASDPAVSGTAVSGTAAGSAGVSTTNEARGGPDDSVSPGDRLSAAVGVGAAELEGELSERAFGLRVARANSDGAKAGVVADQQASIEERLTELEERKAALQAARENGSISEGRYRAEMAQLAAETRTVERLANATQRTAAGLPADVLESKGVDVEAIRTLKEEARNLTGPEVAEIARSIAGRDVGERIGPDRRPDLPGEAGNRSDGNGSDRGQSDDRGQGDDRGKSGDSGNAGDAPNATDGIGEGTPGGSDAADGTGTTVSSPGSGSGTDDLPGAPGGGPTGTTTTTTVRD